MSFTLEVVCATSLDGKISTPDRRRWRWSDPEDHAWLLSRMAAADLLVMGAGTVRAENPSVLVPEPWARRRKERGRTPQPARLVVSPSLSLAPDSRAVRTEEAELLIASRPGSIEAKRATFPARVRWIEWSDDDLRSLLARACDATRARRIVCLGGGRTNAALLEQDLVDRLSLTISSFVIGARDAPGPFDGRGFPPEDFPRFRLRGTRAAGRDLILEYERDRTGRGRDPATGLD